MQPVGDPMLAGVGPGSVAVRPEEPERTASGEPRVRPLRSATAYGVADGSPDPRGMSVVGADDELAGTVSDLWIDLAESQLRYLEVELVGSGDGSPASSRRLLPIAICRIEASGGCVRSGAILAEQFAGVPETVSPDQVTMMEEERITAYYGSGYLYATPDRQEAIV
jgi:photosynthetic reaction center H subunit